MGLDSPGLSTHSILMKVVDGTSWQAPLSSSVAICTEQILFCPTRLSFLHFPKLNLENLSPLSLGQHSIFPISMTCQTCHRVICCCDWTHIYVILSFLGLNH